MSTNTLHEKDSTELLPSPEQQREQYANAVLGVIGTKYLHFVGCFAERPRQPDTFVIKNPTEAELPFEVWAEHPAPTPMREAEKQRAIAAYDVLRGQVLINPQAPSPRPLRLLVATNTDRRTLYNDNIKGKPAVVMVFNPQLQQYEAYGENVYALTFERNKTVIDSDIHRYDLLMRVPSLQIIYNPDSARFEAFNQDIKPTPSQINHKQIVGQWLQDNQDVYQVNTRFPYATLVSAKRPEVIPKLKETMLKLTRAGIPFNLKFIDGDFILYTKTSPANPELVVQAACADSGQDLKTAAAPLPAGTPPEAPKLHAKDSLTDKKTIAVFLNEVLDLPANPLQEAEIEDKSLDPNKAVEGYVSNGSFQLIKILTPSGLSSVDNRNALDFSRYQKQATSIVSGVRTRQPCKIVLVSRSYGGSKFTYEFKIVVPKEIEKPKRRR